MPQSLFIMRGRSRKILQVTGDWDAPAGVPTLSRRESRAGVIGTDLGSSFEHKGRLCFLLATPRGGPGRMDCLAFSTSTEPEKLALIFRSPRTGSFCRSSFPAFRKAGWKCLREGFPSAAKSIWSSPPTGARRPETWNARSWRVRTMTGGLGSAFTISRRRRNTRWRTRGLSTSHEGCGSAGDGGSRPFSSGNLCVRWGTGAYRKSNPALARVLANLIEDPSALRYYAGTGTDGHPRWSPRQADAAPLFDQPQLGEFSVAWIAAVQRWVMLYNATQPRASQCAPRQSRPGRGARGRTSSTRGRTALTANTCTSPGNRTGATISKTRRENVWAANTAPISSRASSGATPPLPSPLHALHLESLPNDSD